MVYKLKDNSVSTDPRLNRLVQFDERSRSFPIRTAVEGKAPRSYTWRCTKWLDQGQEGACVGFGVSHELAARPSEVLGVTETFARAIYHDAQQIDPWPGGSYPGADPFYEGTSVLAGVKIAQAMNWFKEYRWAFGLNDLKLGVGYNGPAVIGVNWYEGMFNPDSKGYLHVSGALAGGHCTLVNKVNVREGYFGIHNSWGQDWGSYGTAKISFEDMDKLLHQDGEAVFFLHRTIAPK